MVLSSSPPGGRGAEQGLVDKVFVGVRRRIGRRILAGDLFAHAFVQLAPAAQRESPRDRHFRQHVDAVAYVFGALVVMRRGRQHGVRPALGPIGAGAVEIFERHAEDGRLAAHFVECAQRKVAVEGRVLDPLGRDRRAELLEPGRESPHPLGEFR